MILMVYLYDIRYINSESKALNEYNINFFSLYAHGG